MTDARDPGWRLVGTTDAPPLVRLRFLFTAFLLSPVTFLLALWFLIEPGDQWRGDLAPDWALWIPFAVSGASLLGAGWARGRALSGTTAEALYRSYNTRFLLGVALAEFAALLGVVIAFATSRLWPYLVCLAASLVGFALMAPTARNIERDEERLRAAGSPMSLWDALTRPPDPSVSGNR